MTEAKPSSALPNKLWVGSYEFTMRVVPPSDDALKDDAGAVSDGMTITDEDARGIWIASNLDMRRRLEIVIHEITHAINWAAGIEDGLIEEETIADRHGSGWARFLLDNPRYVRWLVYTVDRIRKEQKRGDA